MRGEPELLRHNFALVLGFVALSLFTDIARGQEKPKVQIVPQIGHVDSVYSVAFSPDGARVLSTDDLAAQDPKRTLPRLSPTSRMSPLSKPSGKRGSSTK